MNNKNIPNIEKYKPGSIFYYDWEPKRLYLILTYPEEETGWGYFDCYDILDQKTLLAVAAAAPEFLYSEWSSVSESS